MGREGKPQSPSERDSNKISLFIGVACGVAISALILSPLRHGVFLARHPVVGGVIGGAAVLVAEGISIHKRSWLAIVLPFAVIPGIVIGVLERQAGHRTALSGAIEAAYLIMVFCFAVGAAMFYARRVRELERRLFTEATSAAFFVTVIATGIYGALELFVDMPRLPVIWVPVFGALVWATLGWIFGRRYS